MADEFDEVVEVKAEDVTDLSTGQIQDGVNAVAVRAGRGEELPALAGAGPLGRPAAVLPAAQAAAVVATGFVAGAAAASLVRRRSARKLSRSRADPLRGPRRQTDRLSVLSTRTYLVQVHVLGRPGD